MSEEKKHSLQIEVMQDGGYVVGEGLTFATRDMYRGQLFAASTLAEALEWVRSKMVDRPAVTTGVAQNG